MAAVRIPVAMMGSRIPMRPDISRLRLVVTMRRTGRVLIHSRSTRRSQPALPSVERLSLNPPAGGW